jgi:hypothetical protein
MEKVNLEKMNLEILAIKKMLVSIQEFIEDSFLTPEEEKLVENSLKNPNKLVSSRDLRSKLNL